MSFLMPVVWWLGIIIMVVAVLLFFWGVAEAPEKGEKDGRTKTGYKDNILPDPGKPVKAGVLKFLSFFVLVAGFIIFGEGGGWDGAGAKCKPGSTRIICK